MKPQETVFLAGESIPFGRAISVTHAVVARDARGTWIAAVALTLGGLACLVWVAAGYAAAL
jgi:hypothetical protein